MALWRLGSYPELASTEEIEAGFADPAGQT